MRVELIVLAVFVAAVAVAIVLMVWRKRPQTKSGASVSAGQLEAVAVPTTLIDDEPDDQDLTKAGKIVDGLPSLVDEEDPDEPNTDSKAVTLFEDDLAGVDEPTGRHELVLLHAVGTTDPGKKRPRNEDSYLVMPEDGLFVVADGMGGYAGGDVASKMAVSTIGECFKSRSFDGVPDPKRPKRANELVWAIDAANDLVYREARAHAEYTGMGTTVVAARFSVRKQRLYVGNVGDSRCYRVRGGDLKQITIDHTLASKGVTGKLGSSLRRAVGMRGSVKVDVFIDVPTPGDTYAICSDGLTKMLSDERIRRIMLDEPIDRAAQRLVDEALAAGGKDNVTVVLVSVREPAAKGRPPGERQRLDSASGF